MKLSMNLPKCTVEIEADKPTDLFKEFARCHEVFGETKCGLCGCDDIAPVARQASDGKKSYDYYEWVCKSPKCRAKLALGQQEGGLLFPKRKLKENGAPCKPGEEGVYRNNGWTTYRGHDNESEESATPAQGRPPRK